MKPWRMDRTTLIERVMRRGEIWLTDLNPTVGSEIRKRRSCLVVSDDHLSSDPNRPLVTVLPLTSTRRGDPYYHEIHPDSRNHLKNTSYAVCNQPRTVDKSRLVEVWGEISPEDMKAIALLLRRMLGLGKFNL